MGTPAPGSLFCISQAGCQRRRRERA